MVFDRIYGNFSAANPRNLKKSRIVIRLKWLILKIASFGPLVDRMTCKLADDLYFPSFWV